jgi:stearoyl-CoA desaturase (delta-9 desaturase)
MSRAERYANLAGVIVPFIGVLLAVVLLWNSWVDGIDLAIFALMYLVTAGGITVGFHRMLTHKSFQTKGWLKYTFAVAGSLSVQGSVLDWVADHRKHHAHTDQEGDPHSPHVGGGEGLRGLYEDPKMRWIGRRFPLMVLASLLIPTVLGYVLHGFTVEGAIRGYIWGGLVRIFLVHHVTWSVNSICHFFGSRRFDVEDKSTNVAWLALPSLGESWHHNHHAFPRSAEHGLKWYEVDPSAAFIRGLEKLGLAWDVVRIAPERQQAKLVGAERELTKV